MTPRTGRETGAFAVIYALLVVLLFVFAALVVDIGGLRLDRRMERTAADAAATAGAALLVPTDPSSPANACRTAMEYAASNLQDDGTLALGPCAVLNGTCVNGVTSARTATGTAGRYRITVAYPVPDSSALMVPNVAPDTVAARTVQPVNPSYDGLPCQRIAVSITARRDFSLAAAAGFTGASTEVHSVARTEVVGASSVIAPLVVLDPTHCNTLTTSGQGDIRVRSNGDYPGVIAVDSDGTRDGNPLRCDSPNRWVLDSQGTTNGRILAMPGGSGAPPAIYSYALLGSRADRAYDPGDVVPNCDPTSAQVGTSGKVCPRPTALGARITRAPWDSRFGAFIDALRDNYGGGSATAPPSVPTGSWTTYGPGDAVCRQNPPDMIFPVGNHYFACTPIVKNAVWRFSPGSTVVFGGNLTIATGGCVYFNAADAATDPATPCPAATVTAPPEDMVVYMQRGAGGQDRGILAKDSDGSLVAPRTVIVQSGDESTPDVGRLTLNGGAGRIYWTGLEGTGEPYRFGLAYWSEGRSYQLDGEASGVSGPHVLAGQSNVTLTGVMFMPNAQVTFNGQTGDAQFRAQFVAYRVDNSGQSSIDLEPDPDSMVAVPIMGVHLIR